MAEVSVRPRFQCFAGTGVPVRHVLRRWRNARLVLSTLLLPLAVWLTPFNGVEARISGAVGPEDPRLDAIVLDRENHGIPLSERGGRRVRAAMTYLEAQNLAQSGDTQASLAKLRQVLELDPGHLNLIRTVAWGYAQLGRHDDAIALLEEAVQNQPDQPEPYLLLSNYYGSFLADSEEGRTKAFEVVEKARERFPRSTAVYDRLTDLLLMSSRRDRVQELMDEVHERGGDDPHYWLQMGRIAQKGWPVGDVGRTDDVPKVNRFYERARSLANGDLDVLESVADFYIRSRQYLVALGVLEALSRIHPEALTAREKLVRVYRILERPDRAMRELEALVEINPYRAELRQMLAESYEDRELWPQAIEQWRSFLEIRTGEAEQYQKLARLLLTQERHEEAINVLRRGLFHYQESIDLSYLLAMAHTIKEEYEAAFGVFSEIDALVHEKGIEENLDAQFFFNWGVAAEHTGRIDEAAELLRESIELGPDNAAQVLNYLGYMWLEQDQRIDEAGALIKRALQMEPESGAIVDSLGWYYFKKGNYEEALVHLQRAEEFLGEPDPEILDHIGQTLAKLGRFSEAVRAFDRALAADVDLEEKVREEIAARRSAAEAQETAAATGLGEADELPVDEPEAGEQDESEE